MSGNPTATLMEPDDLLEMRDGDNYELIDGIPVEKQMGARASRITVNLTFFLAGFVRQNPLGHVYDGQTGFQCFPDDARMVRKPDLSFVARGRLPGEVSPDGHIKLAPDLAVEVVSTHDLHDEVEAKIAEYRSAGVKLIWIVSPAGRNVVVRRLDGTASEVGEAGDLSGEDVLPGFTCRVADLFA